MNSNFGFSSLLLEADWTSSDVCWWNDCLQPEAPPKPKKQLGCFWNKPASTHLISQHPGSPAGPASCRSCLFALRSSWLLRCVCERPGSKCFSQCSLRGSLTPPPPAHTPPPLLFKVRELKVHRALPSSCVRSAPLKHHTSTFSLFHLSLSFLSLPSLSLPFSHFLYPLLPIYLSFSASLPSYREVRKGHGWLKLLCNSGTVTIAWLTLEDSNKEKLWNSNSGEK